MIGLIDSHCHLQDERFDGIRGAVIERARAAGIIKMVCCGTSEKDWAKDKALAGEYPDLIIPSFGLHPWYVKERSGDWLRNMERVLRELPSGVGEVGLDHVVAKEAGERQEQREVFVTQLELAQKLNRPVSIHCRRAWESLQEALELVGPLSAGGIVHSYSGGPEMLPILQKYNLAVSFSGSITRTNNIRGHRAVQAVPLEMLLVETDSPDILPEGKEGLNEPANLLQVIKAVSDIRGISEAEVARITAENARRIFMTGRFLDVA